MKKMIFMFLIVFGLSVFTFSQASAGCNIVWTGDFSGSTPTNETSRTPQARHEAFSAIFGRGYTSGPDCYWLTQCIPEGCDGDEDVMLGIVTEFRVCDTGEWWRWYCNGHASGTIQCPCPGGCMEESGTWDVVCENITTTIMPTTTSTTAPPVSTTTTSEQPTVVKLSSFTTIPKLGEVIIEWSTEAETDNAGFNLYRSEAVNGEYSKINYALIPAKGSSTQGASYQFIDNDVQNRKTYYYKLEDIDLNGTSTMHGPVNATPRLIYGIGK